MNLSVFWHDTIRDKSHEDPYAIGDGSTSTHSTDQFMWEIRIFRVERPRDPWGEFWILRVSHDVGIGFSARISSFSSAVYLWTQAFVNSGFLKDHTLAATHLPATERWFIVVIYQLQGASQVRLHVFASWRSRHQTGGFRFVMGVSLVVHFLLGFSIFNKPSIFWVSQYPPWFSENPPMVFLRWSSQLNLHFSRW